MSYKFRERLSQNIKWRVIRETQNWTLDSTDMCSCTRTFMSMYTCAHHIHTDILIQRSDWHCYLWLRQCGSQQYFNCHYNHSATCHAFKMLFFAELCLKVSYIHAVSKTSQNSKTKCLHRAIKNTGMEHPTLSGPKFLPTQCIINASFCMENYCVTSAERLVLLLKELQQAAPVCTRRGKGREKHCHHCTIVCKASSALNGFRHAFHVFISLCLSLSALLSAVICYLQPVCFCSLIPWF